MTRTKKRDRENPLQTKTNEYNNFPDHPDHRRPSRLPRTRGTSRYTDPPTPTQPPTLRQMFRQHVTTRGANFIPAQRNRVQRRFPQGRRDDRAPVRAHFIVREVQDPKRGTAGMGNVSERKHKYEIQVQCESTTVSVRSVKQNKIIQVQFGVRSQCETFHVSI